MWKIHNNTNIYKLQPSFEEGGGRNRSQVWMIFNRLILCCRLPTSTMEMSMLTTRASLTCTETTSEFQDASSPTQVYTYDNDHSYRCSIYLHNFVFNKDSHTFPRFWGITQVMRHCWLNTVADALTQYFVLYLQK